MKVIFEPPKNKSISETYSDEQLSLIPKELAKILTPILKKTIELEYEKQVLQLEVFKYKTMFSLRYIENEINEENGIIKITENGKIDLLGFSATISDKIRDHFNKYMA